MRRGALFLSVLMLALPAVAGVVYEIEVTDHEQSSPQPENMKAVIEGRLLKMGFAAGSRSGNGEMIYRGDRREMVLIDHDEKTYFVIDEEKMKELAAKISEAMSMMEQALANVPESQRAQFEAMMKQKMPQIETTERPQTELKKTGEKAQHNGYACVGYRVLHDGQLIRELWVTDWDNVEGGEEVSELFIEMSEFFGEMLAAIPRFAEHGGADQAFAHMREMDGFPVVTREFGDDGTLGIESSLRSATRQSIGPEAFEPPSGYKKQEMFTGH